MNASQPFSKKESLFCYFFHLLRNGEQAALSAGYPQNTVSSQAAKLLQRHDLQAKIADLDRRKHQQKLHNDVIAGLQRLAFGSIADPLKLMFHDPDAPPLDFDRLDLFAISEIKRPKDGSLEIKFADRFKALVELSRIAEQSADRGEVGSIFRALQTSAESLDSASEHPDVPPDDPAPLPREDVDLP